MEHDIIQEIHDLELYIFDTIESMIKAQKLAAHKEEYAFWQMDRFNYTSKGIGNHGATLQKIIRPNWLWSTLRVNEVIHNEKIFIDLKNKISSLIPNVAVMALESYANKIIEIYFQNLSRPSNILLNEIRKRFVRDLNQEEFNTEIFVELKGLTLATNHVVVDDYTIIRRTTKEDLEKPKRVSDFGLEQFGPNHTAIMEISHKLKVQDSVFLKNEYTKRIIMLQLFCAGSIIPSSCGFSSDLIVQSNIGGKSSSGKFPWKIYYLEANLESQLQIFFQEFKVPEHLYVSNSKVDHLTVAFDRYKESLLEIVKFEQRIATTVMGVEALLSNDTTELKFRMKTRVARLLGCIGCNPIVVRDNISRAYDVRSTFAHGSFLSTKESEKIKTFYGALDDFSMIIIDYLRMLTILLIGCGLSKKQLIELTDDSMIDETAYQQLKNVIYPLLKLIPGAPHASSLVISE